MCSNCGPGDVEKIFIRRCELPAGRYWHVGGEVAPVFLQVTVSTAQQAVQVAAVDDKLVGVVAPLYAGPARKAKRRWPLLQGAAMLTDGHIPGIAGELARVAFVADAWIATRAI